MQVTIGDFIDWIGPRQIARRLLFWHADDSPAIVRLGNILEFGVPRIDTNQSIRSRTWFAKLCDWVYAHRRRKVKVRIDDWDTWNLDNTLALVILPALRKFKAERFGSPQVDIADVPEYLRYTDCSENFSQYRFDFYTTPDESPEHARFEWVLDEMIWAFEQLQPDCDWESDYYNGTPDFITTKTETGLTEFTYDKNSTSTIDSAGLTAHSERIANGLRLFGKYYRTLWI